ncbi:kelch repeat-containing protein [Paenibacillus sp. UMB4589-SE434]|uniref:Kelch repeat-containing protein n=1 Tax=Paenibacillus sp. UMB4589-SE434 TaxID=3046314 RepID=UPI00254FF1A0|nr:kelch repeat-containing protein [Paenibacillus sp. UMB4589-SE434]MDK8179751.1 kelch repeat-containing protein [Paenibacillus sp. UMB4589-SE434]
MNKWKFSTIFFVFLIFWLSLTTASVFAADSMKWVKKSDLPEPRAGAAVVTVDGKIYVFGGASDGKAAYGGVKRNNTFVYDTTADKWSEKKAMPTTRAGATASAFNGKIYVFGGYYDLNGKVERTNKVEVYDPKLDSWSQASDMPTARSWASSIVIGDKIYVIAGGDNTSALSVTECFDPITNTWSKKTDMPITSNGIVAAEVSGNVYVFGGWDFTDSTSVILKYDPAQDTWTQTKHSSVARNAMSIAVVDGKIYILGGSTNGSSGSVDKIEVYDPKSNTLTNFDKLTFPRTQAVSSVVNNNLYIIGGTTSEKIVTTLEMYTFGNKEVPEPEVPEQPQGERAILVVTMNTGLEKEFDLSMQEVNAFITWYENKQAGSGTASYAINKHNNNRGPFSARRDYVIFDKILTFEVNEYNTK